MHIIGPTLIFLVSAVSFTSGAVPTGRQVTEPWEAEYRIPTTTVPLHYDVYLHPNLDSGLFTGRTTIDVSVTSPMSYLVTHIKYLNISSTKLRRTNSEVDIELDRQFEYEPNEFWVIVPREELTPGNYSILLEFNGSLNDKIIGFYKSVYTNANGEKRSLATSKFQPTYARQAFPCFDEPSFKSTFNITLVRPSQEYIALSNMPVESQTPNSPSPGLTEVKFMESVPMVTYLVIFIVCDFGYVEAKTKDNKPFRVYARKEQLNRTQYALEVGVDILNFFEEYFEIKYPLPKMDMIAIPDFSSGAMEHWGLITYREARLLYDPSGSSSSNKQSVARTVSHELAHMWFGNLMTLKWWNDLWLNEGFASYVEYKGVAQYETDWDMLQQFVPRTLQTVFNLDAKLSSHPIVQEVNNPNEITELFDRISYYKGASVLRMLNDALGEEPFRIGVRNFLRDFSFSNAVTADLWRYLSESSNNGLPVADIMDTWTRQMGFPVVNVRRTGQDKVQFTQDRFLADPAAVSRSDSTFGYKWDIPLTYRTATEDRQLRWFNRNRTSLEQTIPNSNSSWVKVNVQQHGYYRVNYDQSMWNDLIKLLNADLEVLTPADRANLIDDAYALASSDLVSYSLPLNLSYYLVNETNLVPWYTVVGQFHNLNRIMQDSNTSKLFQQYVLQLVEPHAIRLGWTDNGTHNERRLRPSLIGLASEVGSEQCLQGANARLQQWFKDPNADIPANLRAVVFKYGMKLASREEWETMFQRYVNETNAQEKAKLMSGLTAPTEPAIIKRFLEAIRNESSVRSQDYLSSLARLAANPSATQAVWEFIKSEWSYLVDRFTINSRTLGKVVKSVIGHFTTTQQLQDVEAFFAAQPEAGAGKRAREQGLETIRKNIGWLERNVDTINQWLVNNVQMKRASTASTSRI